MGGYFNRGTSAGGHDEGCFDRADVTGPAGVGSATGAPGGVGRMDNSVADQENLHGVRAIPQPQSPATDETAGTTTGEVRGTGSYPDIVEGSDCERTGTSWGRQRDENGETGGTARGDIPEGTGEGEAHPNRNAGDRLRKDSLSDVGSCSTISSEDSSAGSPTGNS